MELAFSFAAKQGIPLESDVPYEQKQSTCNTFKGVASVTGYIKLRRNDALALETALATKGPIAVTAAAGPWQFYGGGVFDGCKKQADAKKGMVVNHAVQAV